MEKAVLFIFYLTLIACGSVKQAPTENLENWIGKDRDEVKTAFAHLTPKTEKNKITYRDSDPIPTPSKCAVIDCYPWTFRSRINCTYVFKFESDRVVKATRSGNCRD